MDHQQLQNLQIGYDRVVHEYAERIFGELKDKPLDRHLLDRFAAKVLDAGPVCDLGCGPGHVARYLHARGVNIFGLDLSQAMVEEARKRNPGLEFRQGNMLSLEAANDEWGGIVAFYSIIHIPRAEVHQALCEMRRVLRPGGQLSLGFHVGEGIIHLDEWWGQQVSLDFYFFTREEMEGYLLAAGFEIEEVIERDPYPEVEHQSRRAYVLAKKHGRSGGKCVMEFRK